MTLIAILGTKALWGLYAWLGSAIIASYLSSRKGYSERLGLALGMILSVVGVVIILFWPAKPDSRWKLQGPFGTGGKTVAEARAEKEAAAGGEG